MSIYLNHKKHDDSDNLDDLNASFDSLEENVPEAVPTFVENVSASSRSKKIREKLGNFVTSLGRSSTSIFFRLYKCNKNNWRLIRRR